MAGTQNTGLVKAPVPDAAEYTVSAEIWNALTDEINSLAARIDAQEELTPEDVVTVRSLKKQVEFYLTQFNKAMQDAQATYKGLLARQLNDLGYPKIEAYIQAQRKKQTDEQDKRIRKKQAKLRKLVTEALDATVHTKGTALAGQLLPAFASRFPNVNSGAKDKNISNWEPYQAIIRTTMQILEGFFGDPNYRKAACLPVTSASMQQLLGFVRDGDFAHLSNMKEVFARDAGILQDLELRAKVTSKEIAVKMIAVIAAKDLSPDVKIQAIGQIVRIAETI